MRAGDVHLLNKMKISNLIVGHVDHIRVLLIALLRPHRSHQRTHQDTVCVVVQVGDEPVGAWTGWRVWVVWV